MLTDDERKTIERAASILDAAYSETARKLRAIAAPRVATVGWLLAMAPVGITMWTAVSGEAMRYMVIDGDRGRGYCQFWSTTRKRWCEAILSHLDIVQPARWISLGDFDPRDLTVRGPIGEG